MHYVTFINMKKTKEAVSYNMSRIRGKDTSIEKMLREQLYASNHRYRKNVSSLPGNPDILLSKYRICIFCDGDFFHGYNLNKIESQLKENKDFWYHKILKNQERDRKVEVKLVSMGYVVLRFWEHEIKYQMKDVMNEIEEAIDDQKEKLNIE